MAADIVGMMFDNILPDTQALDRRDGVPKKASAKPRGRNSLYGTSRVWADIGVRATKSLSVSVMLLPSAGACTDTALENDTIISTGRFHASPLNTTRCDGDSSDVVAKKPAVVL